jgi:7-cyano-7-deazaguanine synthase
MALTKKAIVIHSGGMDSSLCLALAAREFGKKEVLSLSFNYGQRHSVELQQAAKICRDWEIDHVVLDITCLKEITEDAITNSAVEISFKKGEFPNTLVVGRNGLMARLGAIHANHLGAQYIYMGIIEVELVYVGYRDCTRHYMDLLQEVLRIDLKNPNFEIRTPVVRMTKKETLELAHQLGVLEYLLNETITCYRGVSRLGCQTCPACFLRNEGIRKFAKEHPDISLPYLVPEN